MRISTVINDWTALVYAIPFDGHTGFSNHNHARNFVRYLYSQSNAHQPSAATALNFCLERQEGAWLKGIFNTDPGGMVSDFLRRRFPQQDADKAWFNDGFYPLFAVRTPKGTAVSNFLRADDDAPLFVDNPLMNHLGVIPGLTKEQVEKDIVAFWGGDGVILDLESSQLDASRLGSVESIVHKAISQDDADVILSVSHRDQPDTNPYYHIHRLRFFS